MNENLGYIRPPSMWTDGQSPDGRPRSRRPVMEPGLVAAVVKHFANVSKKSLAFENFFFQRNIFKKIFKKIFEFFFSFYKKEKNDI